MSTRPSWPGRRRRHARNRRRSSSERATGPPGAAAGRPERARRGCRREAPHSRGSTSLSATLGSCNRLPLFAPALAANGIPVSDRPCPAIRAKQGRGLGRRHTPRGTKAGVRRTGDVGLSVVRRSGQCRRVPLPRARAKATLYSAGKMVTRRARVEARQAIEGKYLRRDGPSVAARRLSYGGSCCPTHVEGLCAAERRRAGSI
jgi:hypothetical protein